MSPLLRLIMLGVVVFMSDVAFAATLSISKNNLVKNRASGYCAWCCIEMLGLQHGYVELRGLTDRRQRTKMWNGDKWVDADGAAAVETVADELDFHKIPYKAQSPGTRSLNVVRELCDEGLGCVVGLVNWPNKGDSHAVLVVNMTSTNFEFLDPNTLSHYTGSIKWLTRNWNGYAIGITQKKDAKVVSMPLTNELTDERRPNPGFIWVDKRLHKIKPNKTDRP